MKKLRSRHQHKLINQCQLLLFLLQLSTIFNQVRNKRFADADQVLNISFVEVLALNEFVEVTDSQFVVERKHKQCQRMHVLVVVV